LVAEEVAKVDPSLVAPDADGQPYTVRYEAVNAMLLNEFLKAHRKLEEQTEVNRQQQTLMEDQAKVNQQQQVTIAEQQRQIDALARSPEEQAAQLQKVSAPIWQPVSRNPAFTNMAISLPKLSLEPSAAPVPTVPEMCQLLRS
jgi:hypothetical protein